MPNAVAADIGAPRVSRASPRILLALLLLVESTIFYPVERLGSGHALNFAYVAALITLLLYLQRFYHEQRAVLLTGFYQLFSAVGMLASAALIANGVYMLEIRQFGTANGTFWVVLFYFVIGMEMSVLGFHRGRNLHFGPMARAISARLSKAITFAFIGLALLGAAVVFLRYGGPMLQGVDRVTFWDKIVPPQIAFVRTVLLQGFFFVAYYYLTNWRSGKNIITPIVIIILYIASTIVVLGEKLSAFVVYTAMWLAILAALYPRFRLRGIHVIAMIFAGAALIATVISFYLLSGASALFAIARIALQAQLLWSVLADTALPNLTPGDISCFFGCDELHRGIDFISNRYLPQDVFSFYSRTGSQLSGFFPALSILTFGSLLTLGFHVIITYIIGILQYKIISSINEYGPVFGFLFFKLVTSLSLIWFAASHSAIPGVVVVALLIILYRLIFARDTHSGAAYQPVSPAP